MFKNLHLHKTIAEPYVENELYLNKFSNFLYVNVNNFLSVPLNDVINRLTFVLLSSVIAFVLLKSSGVDFM